MTSTLKQELSFHDSIKTFDLNVIKEAFEREPGALNTLDNKIGWPPLYKTVVYEQKEIAEFLLQKGANPNLQNRIGETTLHYAVETGAVDFVKLLMKYGGDPSIKQADGDSVIHVACKRGHLEVLKVLLQFKTDVNVQNKFGKTPLHIAGDIGNKEMYQLLLDHGADPNIVDKWKRKPRDILSGASTGRLTERKISGTNSLSSSRILVSSTKENTEQATDKTENPKPLEKPAQVESTPKRALVNITNKQEEIGSENSKLPPIQHTFTKPPVIEVKPSPESKPEPSENLAPTVEIKSTVSESKPQSLPTKVPPLNLSLLQNPQEEQAKPVIVKKMTKKDLNIVILDDNSEKPEQAIHSGEKTTACSENTGEERSSPVENPFLQNAAHDEKPLVKEFIAEDNKSDNSEEVYHTPIVSLTADSYRDVLPTPLVTPRDKQINFAGDLNSTLMNIFNPPQEKIFDKPVEKVGEMSAEKVLFSEEKTKPQLEEKSEFQAEQSEQPEQPIEVPTGIADEGALIHEWLEEIGLEDLRPNFVDNGYSYVGRFKKDYGLSNTIFKDLLCRFGIDKVGHRVRIMMKLREEVGMFQRKGVFQFNNIFVDRKLEFPSTKEWLSCLGYDELIDNFLDAGFENLEYIILQTDFNEKVFNETTLAEDIGIKNRNVRKDIMSRLVNIYDVGCSMDPWQFDSERFFNLLTSRVEANSKCNIF